jgi:hypothetical protein
MLFFSALYFIVYLFWKELSLSRSNKCLLNLRRDAADIFI